MAPAARLVQRVVRAHGRRLQAPDRLGARPPQDHRGARLRGVRRRPGRVLHAASRVHDAHGPGRTRDEAQERAGLVDRRNPRAARGGAEGGGRVEGGQLHLCLHRRRRCGYRPRRDGVRQARAEGRARVRAAGVRARPARAPGEGPRHHGLDPGRPRCDAEAVVGGRAGRGHRHAQAVRPGREARALYRAGHRRHRGADGARPAGVPAGGEPRARGGHRTWQRRPGQHHRCDGGRPGRVDLRGRGRRGGRRARAPAAGAARRRAAGRRPQDERADPGGPRSRAADRPGHLLEIHVSGRDRPARPHPAGDRRRQPRQPAARHRRDAGDGRQPEGPDGARLQARAGRRHGDDGRVVRLPRRGAAARRDLRLPDPRGAVRVVHRPAVDHALAAAVDCRHGRHARADGRHHQHHVAHRPHHADGPRHQERHPARGLHQGAARAGHGPAQRPWSRPGGPGSARS